MKKLIILPLFLILITLTACEERSKTAVTKVHWDRDMCARCVMVVSDRANTIQVRNPKNGKTYMFDDIGCMVLWFKDEKIKWKNEAVIWITDVQSKEWIDARKALYTTENITPMAYGFSAHKDKKSIKIYQDVIGFDELIDRILKKEGE